MQSIINIGIVDIAFFLCGGINLVHCGESLIDGIFAERGNDGIVTLYYGADTPKEDAEALCDKLAEKYPDAEFSAQYGGQPLYYYYVAVE